jgi:hypothetical protein
LRFREVAEAAGVEAKQLDHGLGSVFTDVDRDGRLDLYVANDTDANRLYANVPWPGGVRADPARLGFRLRERARDAIVGDPLAGMGVAAADYDGDLRPDLFVTNSHRQLHAVYGTAGPRAFADVRQEFAPAFDTRLAGWGIAWTDLDLDGDLDVALANGAIPVTNLVGDREPVQVLGSRPDGIADLSRSVFGGAAPRVIGRGLAAADYDNDGDVDLAVASIAGRLLLLRSSGARGHWLEVRLRSFSPGAVVTAVLPDGRTLVREVQAGSSYLSSEDPRVHFGLGKAGRVAELAVRRPDGTVSRRRNLPADRIVTLD